MINVISPVYSAYFVNNKTAKFGSAQFAINHSGKSVQEAIIYLRITENQWFIPQVEQERFVFTCINGKCL